MFTIINNANRDTHTILNIVCIFSHFLPIKLVKIHTNVKENVEISKSIRVQPKPERKVVNQLQTSESKIGIVITARISITKVAFQLLINGFRPSCPPNLNFHPLPDFIRTNEINNSTVMNDISKALRFTRISINCIEKLLQSKLKSLTITYNTVISLHFATYSLPVLLLPFP